jgi:hypothetical protein
MVIAFCCLLLGVLIAIAGLLLSGKALMTAYLTEAVLYLVAAVLFLFFVKFYQAANNGTTSMAGSYYSLGSGSICVVVFSFLSAACGLGGVLLEKNSKAN